MESQLTAAPTAPIEENDDRYVAICSRIKVKGEALREEVFSAIENDDLETAFRHLDTIQKIDRAYMLSLQRGMGIHEAKKKRAALAAEAAMPKAPPAPEYQDAPPERRRLFDRIFNR